jgi:hypothetical protein
MPVPELEAPAREDRLEATDHRVPAAHRWRPVLVAGGGYLALSIIVWWNVWSSHPTSTTTCGCGDTSLFIWFIEWPAYALAHGLDPFYSSALFHPGGIDLLSNTSVVGIGVLLAPVTWLFGPVASLNLALTLAPVLSALAAFVLVRRWVAWTPAAFAAGLFYGFSPFVIVNLTNAYLMTGMAVIPPLLILGLDELFFRQRRPPVVVGILLGLLAAAQFFIGTEALIIMTITALLGTAVVVGAGACSGGLRRRQVRHAAVGLLTGAVTAVVLLAYPTWFALAGPGHLSGPVWPASQLGYYGTVLRDLVLPSHNTSDYVRLAQRVGGYQGPWLSPEYLGLGALAVAVGGLAVWRRDRRLWFFAVMTILSLLLAAGARKDVVLPWQWLSGLPLLENVIPDRFIVITYLCVAVMIGLVVDHVVGSVSRGAGARGKTVRRTMAPMTTAGSTIRTRGLGVAAGTAVALVALVPVATYLSTTVPVTTRPVDVPRWFTSTHEGPDRQVLLTFPVPYAGIESAMVWQAVDRMGFAMVGGGGPEGVVSRDGSERAGEVLLGEGTYVQFYSSTTYPPGSLTAMRRALRQWGVDTVVVPNQPGLPLYERVTSVPFVAALLTAVTGQAPVDRDGAWVWTDVHAGTTSARTGLDSLARCASDPALLQSEPVDRVRVGR